MWKVWQNHLSCSRKQDSIPVGCVLPTFLVVVGGGCMMSLPVWSHVLSRSVGWVYDVTSCLVHVLSWGSASRGGSVSRRGGLLFPCWWTDIHLWKHYLPTTSLAGDNKENSLILSGKWGRNWWYRSYAETSKHLKCKDAGWRKIHKVRMDPKLLICSFRCFKITTEDVPLIDTWKLTKILLNSKLSVQITWDCQQNVWIRNFKFEIHNQSVTKV